MPPGYWIVIVLGVGVMLAGAANKKAGASFIGIAIIIVVIIVAASHGYIPALAPHKED